MRNPSLLLLVFSLLLVAGNGWGATYYVDRTGGNDTNPGTTTGAAWKTISKVNASSFSAGDSILFKRGETWQEQLDVLSSGNAGNPITFGAYGTGVKPIITGKDSLSGWDTPGNWTNNGGNIWYKTLSVDPHRLWLSGVEAHRAQTTANSSETWYWDSGTNRLYVYSSNNPAIAFSNISYPVRLFAIKAVNKNYLIFRDLDLRGANSCVMKLEACDELIVESNDIGLDAGKNGIYVINAPGTKDTSNNGIIRNNRIDSGDRYKDTWYRQDPEDGIHIDSGCNNWSIYNNTLIDWGHTGIYIQNLKSIYATNNNKIYGNTITSPDVDYGRGIGADAVTGAAHGNKIYNNLIQDTTVRNQVNMEGLEFYYNIIDNVAGTSFASKAGVGQCLSLEGYGGTVPQGMKIYNNVFANCAEPGLNLVGGASVTGASGNLIKNNIFYNNGRASQVGKDNYQLDIWGDAHVLGNTFTNNLFYKSGTTDLIYYGHSGTNDYPHTVAEFNSENGTASDVISGNISSDPLFVSEVARNYNLRSDSPAIDAGIDVSLTSDYVGNLVPSGSAPDIGAYESTSLKPKMPSAPIIYPIK